MTKIDLFRYTCYKLVEDLKHVRNEEDFGFWGLAHEFLSSTFLMMREFRESHHGSPKIKRNLV